MKLMSLLACSKELREHGVSRDDIYDLADKGMPTVNGKTTPEAILNYISSVLGISASTTLPASQPQQSGRNGRLSPPSHGQPPASKSSGQSRRDVREK